MMTKKRALVTGGSGEIGAAICEQLAADGYAVIVHAHRHGESAQRVAEKITAGGGSATVMAFDLAASALAAAGVAPPVMSLASSSSV